MVYLPVILRTEIGRLVVFRWLLVACQAVTVLVTWPLWQVHNLPPMLPALPLPAFDLGILLLVSLVVILIRPQAGLILNTILFIYATLIDQTRLQPEMISLLVLTWGTLPNPNALAVGRGHLIAMWTWAGVNKLLSPVFMTSTSKWMISGLLPDAPVWLRSQAGLLIGGTELAVGVLALFPRTRKLAGVMAFGLHMGILLTLSPVGHNYNSSVWAWNLGLAFAGLALIAPWRDHLHIGLRPCRRIVVVFVVFLLLSPAGYYFGMMDAYLAHNLYSSNIPFALSTSLDTNMTWKVLNVPLPPEHRLFEEYFRLTCKAGDVMTIRDTRWWYTEQGKGFTRLTC